MTIDLLSWSSFVLKQKEGGTKMKTQLFSSQYGFTSSKKSKIQTFKILIRKIVHLKLKFADIILPMIMNTLKIKNMKSKLYQFKVNIFKYKSTGICNYKNRYVRICMVCIFVILSGNSCNLVNDTNDSEKSLTSYYIDDQNDREFYFYGDDSHLESAILKRQTSSDTLVCYLYDDQIRVKSIYLMINGYLEETVLNFEYEDSIVVISAYSVDFQSDDSYLENISIITKKQLVKSIPEIMQDFPMGKKLKSGQDYICNKFTSIVVTTAALGLVGVWIGTTACLPCAIIAGLGVGIICVPPGNASELPQNNYPPNPAIVFNKIFPSKDILANTEWMISVPTGYEQISFGKNGTLNSIDNFKGAYTMFGRNVKFSLKLSSNSTSSIFLSGVNYYIGTISNDGKGMEGTVYNLNYIPLKYFSATKL